MSYDDKYTAPELQKHALNIDARHKITASGVKDVESFDDNEVVMLTTMGTVIVKGGDLKISRLSLDTGDVSIDGTVDSLEYVSSPSENAGFFARLFK